MPHLPRRQRRHPCRQPDATRRTPTPAASPTPTPSTEPAATPTPTPTPSPTPAPFAVPTDLEVDDDTPALGQSVELTSYGWRGVSNVKVWLHSTPVLLATVHTDATGDIRSIVEVPMNTTTGSHEFVLVGTAADGTPLELRADIEIRVPPPPTDVSRGHEAPLGQVLLFAIGAAFLGLAIGAWRRTVPSTI